jgi:hypothetical protein
MYVGGQYKINYKQNLDMTESQIEQLEINPVDGTLAPGFYLYTPILGGWYKRPFETRESAEEALKSVKEGYLSKHPITGGLTGETLVLWNAIRKIGTIILTIGCSYAAVYGIYYLITKVYEAMK